MGQLRLGAVTDYATKNPARRPVPGAPSPPPCCSTDCDALGLRSGAAGGVTDRGLQQLSRLTRLCSLHLEGYALREGGCGALAALRGLTCLQLQLCEELDDEALHRWAGGLGGQALRSGRWALTCGTALRGDRLQARGSFHGLLHRGRAGRWAGRACEQAAECRVPRTARG